MKKRIFSIDFLRCIGMILIILAYVIPHNILFELRTFDVPLMAIVLGMSFSVTYNSYEGYFSYVKKRFKRLIVPAWCFVTVYLCTIGVLKFIFRRGYSFSEIVQSYLLCGGIGYVWIIRIFFIIALFSPFILKASLKIDSNIFKIAILFIAIAGIFFLDKLTGYFQHPFVIWFYEEWIITPISYIILSYLGIILMDLRQNQIWFIIFTSSLGLLGYYLINHHWMLLSANKYPPTLYFLLYGILCSLFIYTSIIFIKNRINFNKCSWLVDKITWFSKNTMNIYYYHTFFVFIVNNIALSWIVKFIIVITGSIVITKYQVSLNQYLRKVISRWSR